MPDIAAFEVHNVTKKFGRRRALSDFSADARVGGVVGLLGANGAGKSTLLRLLAGVAHPTKGHLKVLGQPVSQRTLGLVAFSSEENHLYGFLTVPETIAFFASVFPGFSSETAERLNEMMSVPTDSRVGHLSRGQRARLQLALAFARRAPLVLLDEPFAGIDVGSRARITDALLQYERPENCTVVLSTHQIDEVELLLDDVIVISSGSVVFSGSAEALRAEKGVSVEAFLREVE